MDAAANEQLYAACRADGSLEQIAAFEQLWASCYRVAYGMLRARPDGEARAADCAQIALIKIQRSLDQCHSPERFLSWAAQITRRAVLDDLRRPGERRRDDLAAAEDLPAPTAPPEAALEEAELGALLREAIGSGRLSPRSQRVVLGRYFREESDEILATAESALAGATVLPSHVQVTRAKNLAKLRADAALLARLREFLGG